MLKNKKHAAAPPSLPTDKFNYTAGNAKIWMISVIVGTLLLIILCFTFYKLWRKLKQKGNISSRSEFKSN